jgi:hypothetical protein
LKTHTHKVEGPGSNPDIPSDINNFDISAS